MSCFHFNLCNLKPNKLHFFNVILYDIILYYDILLFQKKKFILVQNIFGATVITSDQTQCAAF